MDENVNTPLKFALAGNPNAGKTTLFNALTGSRQHVGNYPGVTVEKKEGTVVYGGEKISLTDLPGTYSLTAYSVEEVVARDFLVNEKPGVVINIVDAANLERNLYLSCQLFELGIPVVIALNMIDVARDRGIEIDHRKLADKLGVRVVPIVARAGQGVNDLLKAAVEVARQEIAWEPIDLSYGEDLDGAILEMQALIGEQEFLTGTYPEKWTALKYLEHDQQIIEKGAAEHEDLHQQLMEQVETLSVHLQKTMETFPEAVIADHRYGYIKAVLMQGIITHRYDENRLHTSDKIDMVLTNRFAGPVFMGVVLLGLYHFTFTYSELPVSWCSALFDLLSSTVDSMLPDGQLKSLLVSGIIDGVGGVLGFVPLIMFMFFGLAFLEDSGYLARVAFMLDRIFRTFGLHGNSVMAYIVSGGIAGGCAVPGVMATRTLRSHRERMATLLTAPFMNCGAKLPVLALLIGTFFAENRAPFMFFLTLLAWIVALLVAKLYRVTILKGESTPFVMELPPYRMPTLKGMLIHTWEKTWKYIQKAGTVILGVSILLWVLMSYPGLPEDKIADYNRRQQDIVATYPAEVVAAWQQGGENNIPETESLVRLQKEIGQLNKKKAEDALRNSFAGRLGRALETISWLPGFDWRTNIALVGGFAAKEIVVSTLGTAYSLGEIDAEESGSLAKTLANDPAWSPILSLSLIVFTMFYAPCIVTVVCIVKEAGSWRWGLFAMGFNTVFAFTMATLVYRIGLLVTG